MKLTIDRSRWCRGDENPYLLRESDGRMCCLGFFLRACGLPEDRIKGLAEPQHPFEGGAPSAIPGPATFLVVHEEIEADEGEEDESYFDYGPSDVASDLMTLNDDPQVTEDYRERRIAEVFAKHGHDVVFVDASPEKGTEPEVKR